MPSVEKNAKSENSGAVSLNNRRKKTNKLKKKHFKPECSIHKKGYKKKIVK